MNFGEQKGSRSDGGVVEVGEEGAQPPVEAYRTLCSHYTRGCSFVSPCCGKVYPCRLCHNEKELTHEIDRYKVSEVVCRKCDTRQPAAGSCTECGISFGRYYCSICHLYADEDKQQFHCDKCGLCRVGGRENFFHCETCGYCLSNSIKDTHVCRKQASRDNCPVCMEDLHTSRSAMHTTDCGHLLHAVCYREMLQKGLYQCPQCQRSITDMSSVWKLHDEERQEWLMPLHLRNFKVKVQCRDCRQESEADFHVVGFKCGNCGSYNTVRCGNEEVPEDEAGQGADGGEGGRMNMLLEMIRMIRERRRQREQEEDQSSADDESDEENAPPENDSEGGVDGGGDISEGDGDNEGGGDDGGQSDGRNSPPHQPLVDNQSYDGDESESSAENNPTVAPTPAMPGPHAEPEPSQATPGPHAEPEPSQATASLQSDSHSLHSDSSWETEEMEVIIGGSSSNLLPNETHAEPERENWDSEVADGGDASETTATGTVLSSLGPASMSRNHDAHISLDQNGTTSDDSLAWETANDESALDEPLPVHN